jgi:hypothetical protein
MAEFTLIGREHYELMEHFEREFRGHRLDREKSKDRRARGNVYQSGETNALFLAYRRGYALGRVTERSEEM